MSHEFARRLFVFDLDGVLVNSKEIHFNALNSALEEIDSKYIISKEEQETIFEGLTTKNKLDILTETRGLPLDLHKKIWSLKQSHSISFFKNLKRDQELIEIFQILKARHVDVAVASNCVRETVEACLTALGVINLVGLYLSNEDVKNPKPSSEIYLKCIEHFTCHPRHTTIFEDSKVGKTAALESGATLISVENRNTITKDFIFKTLDKERKKINVLIPMAGEGSRFSAVGYENPKPMIDIMGKSMINLVHDNIGLDAHYIFIAKSEHINKYNLDEHIKTFCKDYTIVSQDGRLDGAAKTALLAKGLINNDDHLLIANSDQYIDWDNSETMEKFINSGADGGILTFKANEEKWSYVKQNNNVVEKVFEKIVVSEDATCGIYYWKSGSDFIKYAEQMIEKNIKTNNEFYICPVYNEAIEDGKMISSIKVREMRGLGTPEDLEGYIEYLNLVADIDQRPYIDSILEISDSEFAVKYKNPSFKIFDRKTLDNQEYIKWDFDSEMVHLPEAAEETPGKRPHAWMLHPIITGLHESKDVSYPDRSVYLTAYTSRFFHVLLEILPKLFLLKKSDPGFKLIILGHENIDEKGDFLSFNGIRGDREEDASCFKFWLDELEIDYECVNIEMLSNYNFNFKSAYVFYESIRSPETLKARVMYEKNFFNGSVVYKNLKMFHPFCLLSRGDGDLDIGTNRYLVKEVNDWIDNKYSAVKNKDKKIYISRKNYKRVHENEKDIEDYFVSIGYESICMEDLSPIDQILLCKSSTDIACYLGSSLVNMYFLNDKTNLIVMSLDSDSDPNFNKNMFLYYGMMMNENVNFIKVEIPEKINKEDITDFIGKALD
jgi:beta-phosphoglucomutase-like phosphatase (HAD superfamily)/dTDP-glucose pyrophosphorylase